jgi:SAM-dependent methyltransferase
MRVRRTAGQLGRHAAAGTVSDSCRLPVWLYVSRQSRAQSYTVLDATTGQTVTVGVPMRPISRPRPRGRSGAIAWRRGCARATRVPQAAAGLAASWQHARVNPEYWNGTAGETWAAEADALDPLLGPLGEVAMAALAPRPGEAILDVGCGAGATTRALAARVGPTGRALGVDVSAPLLAVARARGGAEYLLADASHAELPGRPFDAIFSRFGVMFFEDPARAFAHLRGALAPGGRLAFICWRGLDENAWAHEPMRAALPHLREPPAPLPPEAPGPFAFGDGGRVRSILAGAGFRDVEVAPLDTTYRLGADLEQAIAMVFKIGPLARLVQAQGLDPEPIRGALASAMRAAVSERGVEYPAACHVVTARA